ncbi:hypothetical protein C8R44DRAFT_758620 [Mycena epipterygia]|nr:hypothetical protein C8R44DRAFT_758620 [Mycena epipterygia]
MHRDYCKAMTYCGRPQQRLLNIAVASALTPPRGHPILLLSIALSYTMRLGRLSESGTDFPYATIRWNFSSIPTHVTCPEPTCGRLFLSPRDLKVHSHVHTAGREDMKLKCPLNGCSFKALQLKRLEAHVDSAHGKVRQFQCLEPHCGFSTTSQGAITRHYRERHHIEPPTSGRKPPAPRRTRLDQPQQPVASTSRFSETPSSVSRYSSLEPSYSTPVALSPAAAFSPVAAFSPAPAPSPALELNNNKYYPAAIYYSGSPSPSSMSPPSISSLACPPPRLPPSLPRSCPPIGPHSDQCVRPPTYSSPPRDLFAATRNDSCASSTDVWVSWRDESDVADAIIAVATGERVLCERSMQTCMTEYLPVPEDVGVASKLYLFA